MKDRFDLEQEIMHAWQVVDDIEMIAEHFADSPKWAHIPPDATDAILGKLLGIKELYSLRFDRLFNTFEESIRAGKFDKEPYTDNGFRREYAGPDT